MSEPLYVRIAENVTQQVATGALRPGDRVPSLRELSRQLDVSVSTALQAYLLLENRGYLESRPQSGFYVRTPFARLIPEPRFETKKKCEPTEIGTNTILSEILETAADPRNVQFGVASASPELFPSRRLNLILRQILRDDPDHSAHYDFGLERLRRQIARRALSMGCGYSPDDLTITSGGLEAINLSLRAVAKPGEVIAVETPCYFGILGSAASLNLKVIEIPTHPQEGMDLGELERAIRTHDVEGVRGDAELPQPARLCVAGREEACAGGADGALRGAAHRGRRLRRSGLRRLAGEDAEVVRPYRSRAPLFVVLEDPFARLPSRLGGGGAVSCGDRPPEAVDDGGHAVALPAGHRGVPRVGRLRTGTSNGYA